MRLESVKEPLEDLSVNNAKYWKGEHWAVFVGPQFSKEMEGQLAVSVLSHEDWRTVYPYFRLGESIKHLAEPLAFFIMKKLSTIGDHEAARPYVEGVLVELGELFGEVKPDKFKGCNDGATYCQVDASSIHSSLEAQIAKKNGD